jgi:hypothetical protein
MTIFLILANFPHFSYACKNRPVGRLLQAVLVCDEWEKSHKSCALYGVGELALIFGSKSCSLSSENTAIWVQKLLQTIDVFVVDELDVVGVKIIVFHKG